MRRYAIDAGDGVTVHACLPDDPSAETRDALASLGRAAAASMWPESRDYSNVRGPRPRLQRRGPITDVVFPVEFPRGIGLGFGPTYGTCVHGNVWPEGDYMEPRGRACVECVREAFGGWRP